MYLPSHDNAVAVYGALPTDFVVKAAPSTQVVAPGAKATLSVTVSAVNGFAGRVDLTATGQPSGSTLTFNPASITGTGTSTMTIAVPSNVTASSFSLTVTGTSGTRNRAATPVVFNIAAKSPGLGAIGLNFVGSSATGMAVTERAGVVAQVNWNNASGATRSTPQALVDETGAPTTATVTWTASNTWMTPVADVAGNQRLMKGYLDTTNSSTTTVAVSGLLPRAYDLYVYVDGDNRSFDRSAAYTISGPGITTRTVTIIDAANANYSTTFNEGSDSTGNYVRFSINASAFTLTATPTSGGNTTLRAPVNAIQIVPVSR